MTEEGLITREEAVARIDPASIDQLLHPMIDPGATLDVIDDARHFTPEDSPREIAQIVGRLLKTASC